MALKDVLAGLSHGPGQAQSYADGGPVKDDEDKKPKEDKPSDEPKEDKPSEPEAPEVKDNDADSIIDAFFEENPEYVDIPIEDWPPEALELLKETLNDEGIDGPNGVLPEEEDEDGEPLGAGIGPEAEAAVDAEEGVPDVAPLEEGPTASEAEENPEQDFDIMELAKLVEAGDKDAAWDALQKMFGISSASSTTEPTNALDRMVSNSEPKGNALAELIGSLGGM